MLLSLLFRSRNILLDSKGLIRWHPLRAGSCVRFGGAFGSDPNLIIRTGDLFFHVFLVVFLPTVKVRGLLDRHVLPECPALLAGRLGHLFLVLGVVENGRPVLGPRPAGVRRGVDRKKVVEHLLVGPLVLVVGDPDGLGVVLDVAVGRVLVRGGLGVPGGTPRVADDGFGDALLAIEIALRTPESAHGRLEGGGGVLGNGDEGADLAGFSFLGVYHVVVVALEGREIGALDDVDAVAVAVDAVAADAFVIVAGVFCGGRHRKKGLAAGDQDRCRQE